MSGLGAGFGGTLCEGALGGDGLGLSGFDIGMIGCGRGAPPCEGEVVRRKCKGSGGG